jgi:hypothetical protein
MEQRQHVRYQVEFPATFAEEHTGIARGIVYNLGMGGCKVVSDLEVKRGARLTVNLQIPEQPTALTILSRHSSVDSGTRIWGRIS